MKEYLYKVCGNILLVTCMSLIIPFIIYIQMENNITRFFVICILTTFCSLMSIYFVGCRNIEKQFIRDKLIYLEQMFVSKLKRK